MVILKLQQQSAIINFACGLPSECIWEYTMIADASVCFDNMSRKCVAGVSVAVIISLSSYCFTVKNGVL